MAQARKLQRYKALAPPPLPSRERVGVRGERHTRSTLEPQHHHLEAGGIGGGYPRRTSQKSMSPMPPMPGAPAEAAFFSGRSATIASVVMSRPATEAASCR